MKEIKLSQKGKVNNGKITIVDDENYDYLMQWRWTAVKFKNTYYAMRNQYIGGGRDNPKYKYYAMHREIMKTPDNMECDHAFRNGLDNRKFIEIDGELKINLRNCTHTQNSFNRTSYGMFKSLGVFGTKYKDKTYIFAAIRHNKKLIHLGRFKTEQEAALAYNEAAIKYHGEFANLNIIN